MERQRSRSFVDVDVWKRAHQWVLGIYKLSETFPKHELFGLTSQLRRAAVSIPANFAEGYGKRTKPDKLRFYNIAQGSIEECKYYMILVRDLEYAKTEDHLAELNEVANLLGGYIRAIESSSGSG